MSWLEHTEAPDAVRDLGTQQYEEPNLVRLWETFTPFDGRRLTERDWPQEQLAQHGVRSVLDASAGTGYHTVRFAQEGYEVDAIDGSPAMVAAARRACGKYGVDVDVQCVNWFDLPDALHGRKYDAIALLGNSLTHVSSSEDRVRILSAFRDLLNDDGLLLLDTRGYDALLDRGRPFSGERVFTGAVGGQAVEVSEDRVVIEYRAEDGTVGRLSVTPIRRATLEAELAAAGFGPIKVFGDFEEKFDLHDVDFLSFAAVADDGPSSPTGVVVDVDGPLRNGATVVPGAVEAVRALKEAGHPVAALSNSTAKSSPQLAAELRNCGFPFVDGEVVTAASMAVHHLKSYHPGAKVYWLGEGFPFTEADGLKFVMDGEQPDIVLVGGNGPRVTFDRISTALRWLREGAAFVAMHRNLTWLGPDGIALDIGAVVSGLEAASGVVPVVIGKPSRAAFNCALTAVGLPPRSVVMVGDDVRNDILAAQEMGLHGVLVLTGKTPPGDVPLEALIDDVLPSIADLPELLRTRFPTNAA
jgi:HAD superfamily hydrolase (TIGR01450 family)